MNEILSDPETIDLAALPNEGPTTDRILPADLCRIEDQGQPEPTELLRLRVFRVALILGTAVALFLLRDGWLMLTGSMSITSFRLVILGGFVLGCLLLCTALKLGRLTESKRLRAAELALLIFACASIGAVQVEWFVRYAPVIEHLGAIPEMELMIANRWALNWFAVIVLYGLLIPNEWRRTALVVGVMMLAALSVSAITVLIEPRWRNLFVGSLTAQMLIWLTIAAFIACYGTWRYSELQQQVRAGRKVGQYRLLERIGLGAMGEVYLAEHRHLRRPCAVKIIRPERSTPSIVERFEREVQSMAALTHWNSVEVFDYGRAADGTLFYAMEYLPGLTLDEVVRVGGPLPTGRVIHILRQICCALHEAHSLGLVHRDLKPSNVMLCNRGGVSDVVKILDFGLAKVMAQDNEQNSGIVGALGFMPPEQTDPGSGTVDQRSDLFAVGAIGYFLLIGSSPFARDNPIATLKAHKLDPVTWPAEPKVPEELRAVLERCLHKNPLQRFHSARELNSALDEAGRGSPWTVEDADNWWSKHPFRQSSA